MKKELYKNTSYLQTIGNMSDLANIRKEDTKVNGNEFVSPHLNVTLRL